MKLKVKLWYIYLILSQIFGVSCSGFLTNNNRSSIKNNEHEIILADRHTLLLRGFSVKFVDGYIDGCRSGQYAAGDLKSKYVQDLALFKNNPDYELGWKQGNLFCYEGMYNIINSKGTSNLNQQEIIAQEAQRIWSELKK